MQAIHSPHHIGQYIFYFRQTGCIYWEEKKTLILSDLHFGKTGHFRKAGIAVPQTVFKEDIQRFVALLQSFKPETVIVIGDMFHSHDNKEHELFVKWRKDFEQLHIQLVMGNHDILHSKWYTMPALIPSKINWILIAFHLFMISMIAANENCDEVYVFSGHIHPGISIQGMSKQSLSFPCFYFATGNMRCYLHSASLPVIIPSNQNVVKTFMLSYLLTSKKLNRAVY